MYLTQRYLLTRDPQPYCDDCLVPLTMRGTSWSSALVLLIYDTATSADVAVEFRYLEAGVLPNV
ncbi:hypothetical protein E2C01_099854 [Portunus trituberculatus]|uniref:Uncharacterized protein n=1 Tax=Portunus trituberculatus TaxID=210409 RepID=A0A5B7KAL3_PORTR|nr:hypothetical protein [Portunus trituberculatus]